MHSIIRLIPLTVIVASIVATAVFVPGTARAAGNEYHTIGGVQGTYNHRTGGWHDSGVSGLWSLDLRGDDGSGNVTSAAANVYIQFKNVSGTDTARALVANYPGNCTGYRLEIVNTDNGNQRLAYFSWLHITRATVNNFDLAQGGSYTIRYAGTLKWKTGDPAAPGGTQDPEPGNCAWSGSHLHQESKEDGSTHGTVTRNTTLTSTYGVGDPFNVSTSANKIHTLEY